MCVCVRSARACVRSGGLRLARLCKEGKREEGRSDLHFKSPVQTSSVCLPLLQATFMILSLTLKVKTGFLFFFLLLRLSSSPLLPPTPSPLSLALRLHIGRNPADERSVQSGPPSPLSSPFHSLSIRHNKSRVRVQVRCRLSFHSAR